MAIPSYQTIMLPLLKLFADNNEWNLQNAVTCLAEQFQLTDEERNELLPSGKTKMLNSRAGWARTYLNKAGLIRSTRRGYYQITDRGSSALAQSPKKIDVNFLRQFPEFEAFYSPQKISEESGVPEPVETQESEDTPEELLAAGYLKLRKQLEADVLEQVKSCSPDFFEELVVQLLLAMGYGGSLKDAGKAIGKSGDGGIDGVIKEDKLGLDQLFIQAKRWNNTPVGRPELNKFAGALLGRHAKKGIFITTSTFTKEAIDYVKSLESRIVLIDGPYLAELMFDYGLGVSTVNSYVVKRIDSDFFEEEGLTVASSS